MASMSKEISTNEDSLVKVCSSSENAERCSTIPCAFLWASPNFDAHAIKEKIPPRIAADRKFQKMNFPSFFKYSFILLNIILLDIFIFTPSYTYFQNKVNTKKSRSLISVFFNFNKIDTIR